MVFQGYSIDGIPLHNGLRGWRLLREGTNTQGGVTHNLAKTPYPNRPGYTPSPKVHTEQIVVFNVRCTRAGLDSLLLLAARAKQLTRTDDPSKILNVECASAIPSGDAPYDSKFDVTITLSAYEGVWRDYTLSTITQNIVSGSITVTAFAGLTAPVYDANLFIQGVFGQFMLTDSGGSWVRTTRAWPGSSSTGILFVGSTQQAFLANTADPWTPVSDASQYIDVSGNGGFRITPTYIGGDPGNTQASLTLTTLAQSGSPQITIQGKRAYRMN